MTSLALSFRVIRLGVLVALAVVLVAALGGLQRAGAQTTVMVSEVQQRIVIDDSDATVPTSAEDLDFTVVLRFTVSTEIEKADISAVSAEFGSQSVRITRNVGHSTGSAIPEDQQERDTCKLAPEEELVWDCIIASRSADLFGVSQGEYTISVRGDTTYSLTIAIANANGGDPITGTLAATTATFRIADIVEIASVTLELAEDEPASRAAGSEGIDLVLKILNANNAAADPSAISSILVSGPPPLTLTSTAGGSSCSASICQWTVRSARRLGGRGAESIKITASSSSPANAVVAVHVVNATGEEFDAESPRLTFSGPASRLTLSTPSGTLLNEQIAGDRDEIRIEVGAVDSSGNATELSSSLSLTVRNPDGRTVSSSAISREQLARDSIGRVFIKLTALAASDSPLAVGEYTLRVSQGGVSGEGTFRVAGKANAISMTAGEAVWESGVARITVTADVTDTEGQAVADGTPVEFSADPVSADAAQLVLTGSSTVINTISGRASATYLVVTPGRALVRAMADSIGRPLIVTVPASPPGGGGTEAAVGLSGLDGLQVNAHSSWRSATTARISELFAGLSARGISVVFKWDRALNRYVPYAEHSGQRLPGAVDFNIERDDVLWLGGRG